MFAVGFPQNNQMCALQTKLGTPIVSVIAFVRQQIASAQFGERQNGRGSGNIGRLVGRKMHHNRQPTNLNQHMDLGAAITMRSVWCVKVSPPFLSLTPLPMCAEADANDHLDCTIFRATGHQSLKNVFKRACISPREEPASDPYSTCRSARVDRTRTSQSGQPTRCLRPPTSCRGMSGRHTHSSDRKWRSGIWSRLAFNFQP
jgi:hypothetical protein